MALAVLLPEDDVLVHACLYLFVIVVIVEAQHEAVGPELVDYAQLANDGLVVELVVEASDVVDLPRVGAFAAVGGKLGDVVVYVVVVVREILEGVQLVGEAVFQRLPEVEVGLVGIE